MLIEDNETYEYTSLVVTSELTSRNGVKHFCIDPYHPFSNGQAERAVQTFKLEKMKKQSAGTLQSKLSHFLFHYRLTVGVSPAELLLNRLPHSHLNLVEPCLRD